MLSKSIEKPLASWRGKDRYDGQILDTLTVIFQSGGCSWNRCRMCGYRHERYPDLPRDELADRLIRQVRWVKENFRDEDYQVLKVFTSGSFFDPDEVPLAARRAVAEAFRGKMVIAETRPEYVDLGALEEFREGIDTGDWRRPLSVAVGLETTNDGIREKSIDKGFTYADFLRAAEVARAAGAGVKAYLLMKPPFLTEREARDDMVRSIKDVSTVADSISMNLCTVQSRTEVERLWKQHAYRPPYLWSVLDVLIASPVHVLCDPVGGGQIRGPHNCRACDAPIVKGIGDYSLTEDTGLLRALAETECGCKEEWEFVLDHEEPFCMPLTR
ncbi:MULTISPECIES: archaeosine biosynthesis radical SAM protein RaSEA [unclassified Methanoculleus]|uniref:archaeosine biosynthesis radical SAM protein RaSEA n=1 Tax=unclassified Methanoculleus TaxID=2619537 RepID=UPI0025E7A4DF|nr:MULTISPECIES: archaeosine biosynthesis radical SAM protein RaSEA [unclassified Methanoculleus]MCK9318820.1 archaeosine biosynthesis radical SAM protein RaSEA [Methanoculleus sp.]MDD2254880.1 archaeosine biosynthesis radical SAM protein RaSEA [Methanoculleus sp.]MDD2788999.1 archaeosine biosynthesis radical SAM protein RaSEA [Methanoculleus sp.]MDD3217083.1 archaeosine biosynthesis radical SAM protein RaSEA [Methanoculleus sp.]MDD4313637.1 archaeosine biosynthesis radical SAM protein RaSEA [